MGTKTGKSSKKKNAERLAEATQKAADIIRAAEREAERIIQELRRLQKEKQAEVKEHELVEAKQRLAAALPKVEKRKKAKKAASRHVFQPGDEVKVTSLNQKGYLIEKRVGRRMASAARHLKTENS